jgi:hypothetical protein
MPGEDFADQMSSRMERRDLQHDLTVALAASGVVEDVTFELGRASTKHNDMLREAIEVREPFLGPISRMILHQWVVCRLTNWPNAGAAAA